MKANKRPPTWARAIIFFLCCLAAMPASADKQESLVIDMNEVLRNAAEGNAELRELEESDRAYRLRVDADRLSREGQYAEAIEIYRMLLTLEKNRDDQTLYMSMGMALLGNGQPAEAIPHFDSAIAKNIRGPYWTWYPYMYKGYALFQLAAFAEAVDAFSKSIELNPRETHLYLARSRVYLELGQYVDATRDMDSAVAQGPTSHEVLNLKSELLFEIVRRTNDSSNVEEGCAAAREACDLGDCRVWVSEVAHEYCLTDLGGIESHNREMASQIIPMELYTRSTRSAFQDVQGQKKISELNCTGEYSSVRRGESLLNLDFPELDSRLTKWNAMHYCETEKNLSALLKAIVVPNDEISTEFIEGSYFEWRSKKSHGWVTFISSNIILDPPIFMRKSKDLFGAEPSAQKNLSRLYASGGAKNDFDPEPSGYTNVIDRYDQPPYQCMRFALAPTYFDDYDPYELARLVYPEGHSSEMDDLSSQAFDGNMIKADWTSRWIEPYAATSLLAGLYCVIREEKFPRDKAEVQSILARISVKESITHGSLNSATFGLDKSTGWR